MSEDRYSDYGREGQYGRYDQYSRPGPYDQYGGPGPGPHDLPSTDIAPVGIPKDIDPYLQNFAFPMRFERDCDIVKTTDEQVLNDNIKITTFVRENGVFLLPLGIGVEDFAFEPLDAPLVALLSTKIQDGLHLGVDGVIVGDGMVFDDETNENKISIAIPYVNTKTREQRRALVSVPRQRIDQ